VKSQIFTKSRIYLSLLVCQTSQLPKDFSLMTLTNSLLLWNESALPRLEARTLGQGINGTTSKWHDVTIDAANHNELIYPYQAVNNTH
jgi:hypothetical protein